MSISATLFSSAVVIPQRREQHWGNSVTNILQNLVTMADGMALLISGVPVAKAQVVTATVAASATITPGYELYRLSGVGGAVTISSTEAVADGTASGQRLILQGVSNTNTVTILDDANTDLNGMSILRTGSSLVLIWDATRGLWCEIARRDA